MIDQTADICQCMRAGLVDHTWWRGTVSPSLSESSSSIAALIEPHRATLRLHTPPKAINPETCRSQIFISAFFKFKGGLLKVTKEQSCVWQAHYNDSMTYCVRHEQSWSSSIISWVENCEHYCCLPDENICIVTTPPVWGAQLSQKDYSRMMLHSETYTNAFDFTRILYLRSVLNDTKVRKKTRTIVRCFHKNKLIVSHGVILHD